MDCPIAQGLGFFSVGLLDISRRAHLVLIPPSGRKQPPEWPDPGSKGVQGHLPHPGHDHPLPSHTSATPILNCPALQDLAGDPPSHPFDHSRRPRFCFAGAEISSVIWQLVCLPTAAPCKSSRTSTRLWDVRCTGIFVLRSRPLCGLVRTLGP